MTIGACGNERFVIDNRIGINKPDQGGPRKLFMKGIAYILALPSFISGARWFYVTELRADPSRALST